MRTRDRVQDCDLHGVRASVAAGCSALRLLGRSEFPGAASSVGAARSWAREMLTGRAAEEMVSDVVLLLSEVITNSVIHSDSGRGPDGLVTVFLAAGAGIVHAEVVDAGSATSLPVVREVTDDSDGGRGLLLVDLLATTWGIHHDDQAGNAVWFQVGGGRELGCAAALSLFLVGGGA